MGAGETIVDVDIKQDGWKMDHRALEAIWKMALQRVGRKKPGKVIASYGFSRTDIYGCLKAAAGRGKGFRALESRKRTGRPRKLTVRRERRVFRWIDGKSPMQYQFDGILWSRVIVQDLVRQKFGVSLSLAPVRALLSRLGLTPQKPLHPALDSASGVQNGGGQELCRERGRQAHLALRA
jgi:transposase